MSCPEDECALCEVPATYTCGRCHSVRYCSREHQRQDYAEHSMACRNYYVADTPDMGQQIVATCAVMPGKKIFTEKAFLVGPAASSDLLCLGCYKPIRDENFYKCPDCSWPMCDKGCSFAEDHLLECNILAQDVSGIGIPKVLGETPRYDLIMILRGLLLKDSNPRAWELLMAMESHANIRKMDEDPFHKAAVRYFTEVCNAEFEEDDIHHVRGAIMTNCLVFRSRHNTTLRGLYSQVRLFNHSCVPNIHITTDLDGTIEARAAVKIEKREPMCICYTGTMEPLWKRQQYLIEVYKFHCRCKRCSDPTELGTYFSSPRCPDCRRSYMLPPGDGSVCSWICESCGLKYEFIDVMQEVSEWLYRIDMNDVINGKTAKQLSKEVDKLQDAFNALHYVPLQFTQFLLKSLKEDTYQIHKLRQEIWENHLDIYNILEPGLTRRRGVTMIQLAASTLAMIRAGVSEKEIYLPRVPGLLEEVEQILQSAIAIMQQEPKDSSERHWLMNIHVLLGEATKYKQCYDTGHWAVQSA